MIKLKKMSIFLRVKTPSLLYSVLIYGFIAYLVNIEKVSANDSSVDIYAIEQLPSHCGKDFEIGAAIQPCFDVSVGNNPTSPQVTSIAYNTFYSLSWPLKFNEIGMADFDAQLNATTDTYPVWQSWLTLQDFYLLNPQDENAWYQKNVFLPESCTKLTEKNQKNESQLSKFIKLNPDVIMGPKIDVLSMVTTPSGYSVVDSNEKKLRYQIYMNNVAFNYLSKNRSKLTNTERQLNFPAATYRKGDKDSRGSIFIKAAWKILNEKNKAGLHKSIAFVTNDTPHESCSLEVVGLVGLHIVNKAIPEPNTSSSIKGKKNLWVWGTYEYKNDAPTIKQLNSPEHTNTPWLFFDIKKNDIEQLKEHCKLDPLENYKKGNKCQINNPTTKPAQLIAGAPSSDASDQSYDDTYNKVTKTYFNESGSVWNNYQMVGSQWEKSLGNFNIDRLANVVLEPFTPASGCSQCHQGTDGSNEKNDFIFLKDNSTNMNNWSQFTLPQ